MISHRYRCIFVHIPKTGGTSLEKLIWPPPRERTAADLWQGHVDAMSNKYQTGGLQHLLAHQIRTEVGADIFDAYWRFSIVRNPWDKAVSQYSFIHRRPDLLDWIGMGPDDGFKRYLELTARTAHVQWEPQVNFLRDDNGEWLVTDIGRFEQFEAFFRTALDRLGIAAEAIPHEKRGLRGHYARYYDDESREMIAQRYADDIAAFGYRFASADA